MANNTFTMVNEYFNLKSVVRRCFRTMTTQSSYKQISLVGPIIDSPLDKFYFDHVFADERRYGQIILNFLSNAIKFSNTKGSVSVLLSVISVRDIQKSHPDQQ